MAEHKHLYKAIAPNLRPIMITLIEEMRDTAGNPDHKIDLLGENRQRRYDLLDELGCLEEPKRCERRKLGGKWEDLLKWLYENKEPELAPES